MPAASRLQDLPPEGGYNPISFKRVPLRPVFNWKLLIGGYVAISAVGLYLYDMTQKELRREEIELRSCRNVMYPVLLAERDREYLKQIRRNRDEETKLMANVPGWKVGTWYGEPVYKTRPNDWFEPTMYEYYIHTDSKHFFDRAFLRHWIP